MVVFGLPLPITYRYLASNVDPFIYCKPQKCALYFIDMVDTKLMEKLVSLTKRRGFIFPGSEIYEGIGGIFDLGPLGVELTNNLKKLWWKNMVQERDNVVGLDSSILMNRQVWHTSGHVEGFADPLVECKSCHSRFREDLLPEKGNCPTCGKSDWTPARQFNLMFKTNIVPVEE